MDLPRQVIRVNDLHDITSLEIVQHEKVRLEFERVSYDAGFSAELLAPVCQNDLPCSRLSHNVIHTGTQSYLSLTVHPGDSDHQPLFVTGVLVFLATTLLVVWLLMQWKRQLCVTHCHTKHPAKCPKTSLLTCTEAAAHLSTASPCTDQTYSHNVNDSSCSQCKKVNVHGNCLVAATTTAAADDDNNDDHHLSQPSSIAMYIERKKQPGSLWLSLLVCLSLVTLSLIGLLFISGGRHSHSTPKYSSILKVSVPHQLNVRHIRSYSSEPDLRDVNMVTDASASLVTRLQLLDLSPECHGNLTLCKTHALCDASRQDGGVNCRCNRGFYLDDLVCKPCSTSCEEGFYMTDKCSAISDVVCKPCTQCEGTSYQVAACTSTQDTLCIDVTFPMKQFQSRITSIEELISINVSMSQNVFLEHLHNIKKLETPLYMSNNRQEMQFVWRRPSGLEVKVKVSDMYLIPEYVDLDAIDDAKFVFTHPEYPQDIKDQLRHITEHHCRHPIPDEYDLFLHLARDTNTAAMEFKCDSRNRNIPPCPKNYNDGDTYVYNRLDIPCPKDRDENDPLFRNRANNILCAGNSDILQTIFGIHANETSFLTFPSEECQRYMSECTKCLSRRACIWGSNVTDCCNLGCHARQACQNSYSNTCPKAPVECTKADISKFAIMPRYPSIMQQFSCHLKHQPPTHLYLVTYETIIPSMQFTLGERYKTVKYSNLSDLQNGADQVDFLRMSHHTESKYDDEVILTGMFDIQRLSNQRVKGYTLHKLKKSWEFDRNRGYDTNRTSQNKYRTKIQFERPFLYSTSNWEHDGCDKNATKIVPLQSIFQQFGLSVMEPDAKLKDGRFIYQLLSVGAIPHIRFSMPDNMSILSYYQDDLSTSRLIPDSLKGHIQWDLTSQVWRVTITGSVTACPGLFTVELFSENTNSRIGLYDMLINCPQNFSVVFDIKRNSVQIADIFIAVFNDTAASYRLVLSSVQGPQFFESSTNNMVAMEALHHSPWIPIVAILILVFIASIILLIIFSYCDRQKYQRIPIDIAVPKPDLGTQITLLQSIDAVNKKQERMPVKAKCIMCTLVILYITYAVIFTFSVLFVMFHLVQGSNLGDLTLVSNTSAKIQTEMKYRLESMVNYENKEAERLLRTMEQRLGACSKHLKTSLHDSVPDVSQKLLGKLQEVYGANGVVSSLLEKYFKVQQKQYQKGIKKFVWEFNSTLETNLHKLHSTYMAYLKKVGESKWFSFPRDVYLEQRRQKGRPLLDISDDLTGFLTWLEVDNVQEIIKIKELLMDRLLTMMPNVDFDRLTETNLKNNMDSLGVNFTASQNEFKFTSAPPPIYNGYKNYFGTSTTRWSNNFHFINQTITEREINRDRLMTLKSVIYPLFISVFVFLDILLCLYRFSWLVASVKVFKKGMDHRVPYDSITRKIYFILTGKEVPCPEDSLDHPYDYYMSNKENIWGDNTEMYFLYCQASPKSKEEILRDLWAHKQLQKPKADKDAKKRSSFVKFLRTVYRLFISPVFWRLVIMLGFLLILCLVAKATNDLVTMESAMFLMDTDAMMPILSRQNAVTNFVIAEYETYLNEFLVHFKQLYDTEVQTINSLLVQVAERQSVLLNRLLVDMCNLSGSDSCPEGIHLVTLSVTSCNFLPIIASPYTGFHENILSEFINAELLPLVMSMRTLMFRTIYLLLAYAGIMIICQIMARIIFVYLCNSRLLRTNKIYQLPSSMDQWPEQQSLREKEMYASQSVIAESCESGVYDMTS